MKDTTQPPDIEFETDIRFEMDKTTEWNDVMSNQNKPLETYRAVHDWSETRSLSTTVILAVRRVLGTPEAELPPLHEHINPDALDSLFAPVQNHKRDEGRVTFRYAGVLTKIQADGIITLSTSKEGV